MDKEVEAKHRERNETPLLNKASFEPIMELGVYVHSILSGLLEVDLLKGLDQSIS